MANGDIKDEARARCRVIFPDDEKKFKECVPLVTTLNQSVKDPDSVPRESFVVAQQKLAKLQESVE